MTYAMANILCAVAARTGVGGAHMHWQAVSDKHIMRKACPPVQDNSSS